MKYVDIATGEFMSSIQVVNIVLRYWSIRSSILRGGNELKSYEGGWGIVILANKEKHHNIHVFYIHFVVDVVRQRQKLAMKIMLLQWPQLKMWPIMINQTIILFQLNNSIHPVIVKQWINLEILSLYYILLNPFLYKDIFYSTLSQE